jgi:hypothetical protein
MTKKQVNESIRIAKEGIGECWDDMAGVTGQTPEGEGPMTVTINMPGKNISVTTDSADEIANILKLAGIQVGGMSADVGAEVPAEMPAEEPAVMYVGAEPTVPDDQVPGDNDGDGDHDMADHEIENGEESDEEESDEEETKEAVGDKSYTSKGGTVTQTATGLKHQAGSGVYGGTETDSEEEARKKADDEAAKKEVGEAVEELDEESARILQLAGVGNSGTKQNEILDEGIIDKLKSLAVPKLMKLLGADAEKIASAVKQATGGDLTPSKENAMKVVQALGIDSAAAKPEMAEGIAGNVQGKLIQALYTLGLLGSAGAAASMWGTVGGSFMAVIGTLLLMFAGTFFDNAPGQVGAMGNFGNKGSSAQNGLDDHGMPVKNLNVESVDENDLSRMLEMAGITNEAQSAAQKAAFAKMIAKKNGDKSEDKAEDTDDNKKPDADNDKEVKEEAPATNSVFGQGVYEADRIIKLSGLGEGKLANSPASTSMSEPTEFDSLPSGNGTGQGRPAFGANRANGQGENPMGDGSHVVSVEEQFERAMGEYRKFVAESIARKK